MADESRTVRGTVHIRDDSAERVAWEMAKEIAAHTDFEKQTEDYWLRLYSRCLRIVRGVTPERL